MGSGIWMWCVAVFREGISWLRGRFLIYAGAEPPGLPPILSGPLRAAAQATVPLSQHRLPLTDLGLLLLLLLPFQMRSRGRWRHAIPSIRAAAKGLACPGFAHPRCCCRGRRTKGPRCPPARKLSLKALPTVEKTPRLTRSDSAAAAAAAALLLNRVEAPQAHHIPPWHASNRRTGHPSRRPRADAGQLRDHDGCQIQVLGN